MNEPQLRAAIHDLLAIEREGQLGELRIAFAHAVRKADGLPAAAERKWITETMGDVDVVKANDIARAASELFGKPMGECQRIARDELLNDQWADIALEIIEDLKPKSPEAQPVAQPARRRKW